MKASISLTVNNLVVRLWVIESMLVAQIRLEQLIAIISIIKFFSFFRKSIKDYFKIIIRNYWNLKNLNFSDERKIFSSELGYASGQV